MTATVAPPATDLERLEAKVDHLSEQMAILAADAEIRRRQRESIEDLTGDLSRISGGAMEVATRELQALSETADLADTARLLRRFVETAPTLERLLNGLDQMTTLADDLTPIGPDVFAAISDRLAEAERRGYFTFARAGAEVTDRIVTGFDEDDLAQLGENVVAILETVKEITQPEMLDLLSHMVDAVRAQKDRIDQEPDEAPSLFALVRQVRDPDVRRGIARALGTLRAVSVETGPEATSSTPQPNPEGDS